MKKLFLCIAFFLLFSGCISQENQQENRNSCLLLSSYSFQEIPECSSQEECFKKVNESLFVFPENSFSGESFNSLHSFKNNLASSWLYFNKAVKTEKEINSLCSSGNFSALPEKTNELAFLLKKAFDFSDNAALDSFAFIGLEKTFLEENRIELIPEEDLFNDFIALNQNLNELSIPDTEKNSSSYVSSYFIASGKFSDFSSKAGFYSLYLNEFALSD